MVAQSIAEDNGSVGHSAALMEASLEQILIRWDMNFFVYFS